MSSIEAIALAFICAGIVCVYAAITLVKNGGLDHE